MNEKPKKLGAQTSNLDAKMVGSSWCHISCPHMETGSFEGVIRFFFSLNKKHWRFLLGFAWCDALSSAGLLVELSNHVELNLLDFNQVGCQIQRGKPFWGKLPSTIRRVYHYIYLEVQDTPPKTNVAQKKIKKRTLEHVNLRGWVRF